MTTIARLSIWVNADQPAFRSAYEDRLVPILNRHGLVGSRPGDRPAVTGVFSRLFEVESPDRVAAVASALELDPAWQQALRDAGPSSAGPDRAQSLRYRFDPHIAAAGPGATVTAGPGFRQGLWCNYGVRDGVPYAVHGILQDRAGHLWFANYGHTGGVTCFDGVRFTTFTAVDGLAHDVVNTVLEDRQGHLWFATNAGVSHYDGRRFTTFTSADGLPDDDVLSLLQDGDGQVWVGTETGVGCYDGTRWSTLTNGQDPAGVRVGAMLQDRQGHLWFATGGLDWQGCGVTRYDGERFVTYTAADGLGSDTVLCLAQDRAGTVWAGTAGGASRLDGGRFVPIGGMEGEAVRDITVDGEGHLWFAMRWSGVRRFDGVRWTGFSLADGLANNNVRCVEVDRQGHLWFGTISGLSRYDPAHFTSFTTSEGLSHNGVMCLREDGQGRLLAGTWQGVSRYDGTAFAPIDALAGTHVGNLLEDRRGHLWCGGATGLVRYDGHRCTRFTTVDGLAGDRIGSLLEDRQGQLWIGTWDGLSRYDGTAFTTLTTADGLASNRVNSILEDRQGDLWFATDRGVSRFRDGSFTTFTTEDGLAHAHVPDIMEDRRGDLWFATSAGVSRFDGESFTTFTAGEALVLESVRDILEDHRGNLWFASFGGGVGFFDGQVFQTLTRQDGLVFDVVHALWQDGNDDVWIGTEGGITRYRPDPTPPTVQLQAIIADQRYDPVDGIRIPESQKLIGFEFEGRSWTTPPERMAYVCLLDGHDTDWRPVYSGRIEYQALPPGDYTFRVKAADRDLNYSDAAQVQVTVEPDVLLESLTATLSESGSRGDFVGRSDALKLVLQQLQQVAPAELTVLICGETGTGKGLAARALHELSPRRSEPFVQVTCGAIPEALIEAELFGHEKGAFTSATSRRLGKIELAAGGTLFLDEIGDMPLSSQVKLLRLLEERTFERVGGTEVLHADVRVAAATNRDLRQMVAAGGFREDLYFRLQGFEVRLPALRERREDIPLLALYFIGPKAAHLGKQVTGLSRAAVAALEAHAWPGNVRELQHAIERAVVVCRGSTIEANDLMLGGRSEMATGVERATMEEMERRHIISVLEDTDWVVSGPKGAMTVLAMKESTLRARMKKLGIKRPDPPNVATPPYVADEREL